MTRRGNTSRMNCEICGQNIGACGFAYVSHMRAHVRREEATEHLTGSVLLWGGRYEFKLTDKAVLHDYKRSCGCKRCMEEFRRRQERKYSKP